MNCAIDEYVQRLNARLRFGREKSRAYVLQQCRLACHNALPDNGPRAFPDHCEQPFTNQLARSSLARFPAVTQGHEVRQQL